MRNRNLKISTGRSRGLWPVLVVLLLAVLVPTACVLWFMNAAMKNERLAVRQRLTDVYKQRLSNTSNKIDQLWEKKLTSIPSKETTSYSETFARLVQSNAADSAVLLKSRNAPYFGLDIRSAGYPSMENPNTPKASPPSPAWLGAEKLEYELPKLLEAAEAYTKIAADTKDTQVQAQALRAKMRCLVKAGEKGSALEVLYGPLAKTDYSKVFDRHSRLVLPDCKLLALELIGDPENSKFQKLAGQLIQRVNDYSKGTMPSGQRRFLMHTLQSYWPNKQLF